MDLTVGHSICRAGREEKSKSVAERSRETAEKTDKAEVEAGTRLKGQERASATMFLGPGTWTISLVNSEMKARWCVCLADHGREEQKRARVSGL